jgi:hypothetical protein
MAASKKVALSLRSSVEFLFPSLIDRPQIRVLSGF